MAGTPWRIEAEHLEILRVLSRADIIDHGDESRDIRRSAIVTPRRTRQRGSDLIYEAYSLEVGTGF